MSQPCSELSTVPGLSDTMTKQTLAETISIVCRSHGTPWIQSNMAQCIRWFECLYESVAPEVSTSVVSAPGPELFFTWFLLKRSTLPSLSDSMCENVTACTLKRAVASGYRMM